MKIVKEIITKRYGENRIIIETVKQFHYESEEEKMNHSKLMTENGWRDSGQSEEMISGSLMPYAKNKPVYVWFGSYYKIVEG